MVTLPPFREELPYVLAVHSKLDAAERPIFWYKVPDPDELAATADEAQVNIRHRATGETEERRYHATMMNRLLYRHLLRVERLFEEDGTTPVSIPPLAADGRISPERKRAIARLHPDWRLELVEAIAEQRDSGALLKN